METSNFSGNACSLPTQSNMPPWEAFDTGKTAWDDFAPAEQEAIVKHFAPRVRFIALRLKGKLPHNIELNELISAGTLGLMEAFGKFQPELGNKFETYAESRIRGAMLDDLRRLDWFPRSLRRRVRTIDEAIHKFECSSDTPPTEAEIAQETGLDIKQVREGLEALHNQYCLPLELVQDSISSEGATREEQPYKQVAFSQTIDKLTELVDELTPREKLVLSLYYTEELTMREAAETMDITEGRVSQLHSQALTRLRKNYIQRYGTETP